jgi:NAD+ synthase
MKYPEIGTKEYEVVKEKMLNEFRVTPTEHFDAKSAVRKRIDYLKNFLKNAELKAYILGISGGVDSTTVGRMAQIACQELRSEGYSAQFIAVRLPAGVQQDEADAQEAIRFINADKTLTVNIGEAATNLSIQGVDEFKKLGDQITDAQADFNKGNIKARLRMTTQYQIAAMYSGLVLGTDHFGEKVVAYFSKFGDGACDLVVLNGLNKRQVRLCAKELGAPEFLWNKAPTADLEELNPGKLDDDGFGFPYEELDNFLEGKHVDEEIIHKIMVKYIQGAHKRDPIPEFS